MQRWQGPLSGTTLGDGYALGDLTASGDDGDY
jgi:hypothetical protein